MPEDEEDEEFNPPRRPRVGGQSIRCRCCGSSAVSAAAQLKKGGDIIAKRTRAKAPLGSVSIDELDSKLSASSTVCLSNCRIGQLQQVDEPVLGEEDALEDEGEGEEVRRG